MSQNCYQTLRVYNNLFKYYKSLLKTYKTGAYSVRKHLKLICKHNINSVMDFNKQSVEFSKQPIELVWQQSQRSQIASNPFQKPLSVKQPIETIKQLVVFPLL